MGLVREQEPFNLHTGAILNETLDDPAAVPQESCQFNAPQCPHYVPGNQPSHLCRAACTASLSFVSTSTINWRSSGDKASVRHPDKNMRDATNVKQYFERMPWHLQATKLELLLGGFCHVLTRRAHICCPALGDSLIFTWGFVGLGLCGL